MEANYQISASNSEDSNSFFLRYLSYLNTTKRYFFRKPIKLVMQDYNSEIILKNRNEQYFTSVMSSFLEFVLNYLEKEEQKSEIRYYNYKTTEVFNERRFDIINQSLNDLYSINPTLSQITYLNFILNYDSEEIAKVIGLNEVNINRELELSKAFMLGWIVRDKSLEQSIFPFLDEQRIINFFESAGDKNIEKNNYYLEDINKILSELDDQIDGMKTINSSIKLMEEKISSTLSI